MNEYTAVTGRARVHLMEEIAELRKRLMHLEGELARNNSEPETGDARFRALADSAPVMIWMAGPDAYCTFVNRAWLEFRGRSLDQEIGNGWLEGIHPDDKDLCLETFLKSFSARQPFRMQFRMQRAGGEFRWIEHTGVPRFEDGGSFAGYMGTSVDVSEQRRMRWTPDEGAVRAVFSLTERERQVLVLIAEGRSTKEAAVRLGISYKTADSHRSRILEKLGVHETASMVRLAVRSGLIEP